MGQGPDLSHIKQENRPKIFLFVTLVQCGYTSTVLIRNPTTDVAREPGRNSFAESRITTKSS